jgi:hypothetical protein
MSDSGILYDSVSGMQAALGNRCGHDPETPRFFIPNPKHALRPDIIQFAIANLKMFYVKPKKWLQSLRLFRKSTRQERSEGRERDADVLGVLLHYTELASLRVGVPKSDGGFIHLTMKFIARKLGWRSDKDDEEDAKRVGEGMAPKNRGVKRVWRAIEAFKRAGYITVHPRCEKAEGSQEDYSGLPAVRCIQPKLFFELGIGAQKLRAKRDQAAKRLSKKIQNQVQKIQDTINQGKASILDGILNKISRPVRTPKINSKQMASQLDIEKKRVERCMEMKSLPENQSLSVTEFYTKYPELRRSG